MEYVQVLREARPTWAKRRADGEGSVFQTESTAAGRP